MWQNVNRLGSKALIWLKKMMNLFEAIKKFDSNEKCYSYLESIKWPEGPVCPRCESRKNSKRSDNRYICNTCNRSYSVLHGTLFEASNLPLRKWFVGMILIANAKKGISSLQLARDLSINKNTAWYLQLRIRKAMKEDYEILKGVIETDETHIGGSLENKHYYKKLNQKNLPKGGFSHKSTVLGMLERRGKIIVQVLDKGASGKEIKPIMTKHISHDGKIVTDGYGAYYGLSAMFKKHIILNNSKHVRNYGRYHTNSIEGFWSLLKRAIIGQYHKVSKHYLQSYVDELTFKFNHRNDTKIFENLIYCLLNPPSATF
ncbi:IS1595 family transposase [bacterium AH-315-C07]|nr:IS1595 family transposase [bacterium AH-315-C07]